MIAGSLCSGSTVVWHRRRHHDSHHDSGSLRKPLPAHHRQLLRGIGRADSQHRRPGRFRSRQELVNHWLPRVASVHHDDLRYMTRVGLAHEALRRQLQGTNFKATCGPQVQHNQRSAAASRRRHGGNGLWARCRHGPVHLREGLHEHNRVGVVVLRKQKHLGTNQLPGAWQVGDCIHGVRRNVSRHQAKECRLPSVHAPSLYHPRRPLGR